MLDSMPDTAHTTIQKRLEKMPDEASEKIQEMDLDGIATSLAQDYDLSEKQTEWLKVEMLIAMLGMSPIENLPESIKEALDVDNETALYLADDIANRALKPVADILGADQIDADAPAQGAKNDIDDADVQQVDEVGAEESQTDEKRSFIQEQMSDDSLRPTESNDGGGMPQMIKGDKEATEQAQEDEDKQLTEDGEGEENDDQSAQTDEDPYRESIE